MQRFASTAAAAAAIGRRGRRFSGAAAAGGGTPSSSLGFAAAPDPAVGVERRRFGCAAANGSAGARLSLSTAAGPLGAAGPHPQTKAQAQARQEVLQPQTQRSQQDPSGGGGRGGGGWDGEQGTAAAESAPRHTESSYDNRNDRRDRNAAAATAAAARPSNPRPPPRSSPGRRQAASSPNRPRLTPPDQRRTPSNHYRSRSRPQHHHHQHHRRRQQENRRENKDHHPAASRPDPPIPTSPWCVIANVPPLSSLDDILGQLTRVLDIELGRGIVDLDEAEKMLAEAASRKDDEVVGRVRVDISTEENAAAWEGVDWDGADGSSRESTAGAAAASALAGEESGASETGKEGAETERDERHQRDDEAPALPLWTPAPKADGTPTTSARDLILEARILLSILGRPMGWYIRLPNRSVVHALLSHVEEARSKTSSSTTANDGGGATAASSSTAAAAAALKCGNRVLSIGEFVPPPPPSHSSQYSRPSGRPARREEGRVLSGRFADRILVETIEASFDRAAASASAAAASEGGGLRLDDSVVRVENCPVRSTVDEVRYLFRNYDLVDTRTLRRRRGGDDEGDERSDGNDDDNVANNGKAKGKHGNDCRRLRADVELLVKGNGRPNERHRGHRPQEEEGGEKRDDGRQQSTTHAMTNTFLVRFDTAADARAAIRDMQMVDLMGRRIRLAQYPRQLLVD